MKDMKKKNLQYKTFDRNTYLDMYLKITEQKTRYYACAKLYSSEVASHICYSNGYTAEDVEGTFYAIVHSEKIIETDYIVYHYFINAEGITKGALKRSHRDMYHSWNQVISYAKKNLPEYVEKCQYNLMRIDLPVLVSYLVRPISKDYVDYLSDLKSVKHRLNCNYCDIMKGSLPKRKKIILTLCRIIPTCLFSFWAKLNYMKSCKKSMYDFAG